MNIHITNSSPYLSNQVLADTFESDKRKLEAEYQAAYEDEDDRKIFKIAQQFIVLKDFSRANEIAEDVVKLVTENGAFCVLTLLETANKILIELSLQMASSGLTTEAMKVAEKVAPLFKDELLNQLASYHKTLS